LTWSYWSESEHLTRSLKMDIQFHLAELSL